MELKNLQVLVEVVRQGGFSSAARTSFMTQSAVSKTIRQLEDELGVQLLERLRTGVRLTQAGSSVYGRAIAMLAERDCMLADVSNLKGCIKGTLKLGLPTLGSNLLFAPHFAKYRNLYPQIEIELLEGGGESLMDALRSGAIELATCIQPVPDDFNHQPFCDEPLVAILRTDHPLAAHTTLAISDLEHTPLILFDRSFAINSMVEAACRSQGFEPLAAARSVQLDFIIALVAAGLGLTLLPLALVEHRLPSSVRAVPMTDQDLRWRVALIWRRRTPLSPPASAWLALVRAPFPNA